MNKGYRLVWNHTLGASAAASELAVAGNGDGGGMHRLQARLALAIVLALPAAVALAADAHCVDADGNPVGTASGAGNEVACGEGTQAAGRDSIAIGTNATTSAAAQSAVAIGTNALADGQNAVAFGTRAIASANTAVAIGQSSMASAAGSLALGDGANATGASAVALGRTSRATTQNTTAVGVNANASTESAIAVGANARASGAGASVLGAGATASGFRSTALGIGSVAAGNTTVAIGSNANTGALDQVSIGTNAGAGANGNTGGIAIGGNAGVNIVGTENVAVGRNAGGNVLSNTNYAIGARSGRNVNGADNLATVISAGNQVRGSANAAIGYHAGQYVGVGNTAAELAVVTAGGKVAGTFYDAAGAAVAAVSSNNNIAIGVQAGRYVAGSNNLALGTRAGQFVNYDPATGLPLPGYSADTLGGGSGNVALGHGAGNYVKGRYNIALGYNAGSGTAAAVLERDYSLSLGANAVASAASSAALGFGSSARRLRGVAIGADAKSVLYADGSQYDPRRGDQSNNATRPSVAVGYRTEATGDDAVALGVNTVATGRSSVALGETAYALDTDAIAIGNDAIAGGDRVNAAGASARTGHNSIAIGSYAQAVNGASTAIGSRARAINNGASSFGISALSKGQRSLALGAYSYVGENGTSATAVGYQTIAADGALYSTALGTGAVVSGSYSGVWNASVHANPNMLADAERSYVGGDNNYAIGNKNVIGDQTSNTFILGNNVKLGAASAELVTTNGTGTGNDISSRRETVTYAGARNLDNMVALGSNTAVGVSNGVALGYGSNAAIDKGVVGADPLNAAADKANPVWTSTSAAVSIGDVAAGLSRQITGVAAGAQDTDAVNVAQLKAAGFNLAAANTSGGDVEGNAAAEPVQNGDTVTVDAGSNIKLTQNGGTIAIATKADVVFDSVTAGAGASQVILNDGGISVGGKTYVDSNGLNANDQRITGVANGENDTDAANIGQLRAVQALVDQGWTVTDAQGRQAKIGANGRVTFESADGNIEVAQTGVDQQGKVVVGLNRNLVLDSVTLGGVALDAGGLSIAGGPSITSAGVDAGGKPIANVGAGVAPTDAVNLAQLQALGTAAATHYYSVNSSGPGNRDNDGASGVDAIAIGMDAVAAHSGGIALGQGARTAEAVATPGGVIAGVAYAYAGAAPQAVLSIGAPGGERTIINVAAGRVGADSTDAVNGSQLHATQQAVEAVDGRVNDLSNRVGDVAQDITGLGQRVDAAEINIAAIQQGAGGMFQVNPGAGSAPAPTGDNAVAGGSDAIASGNDSSAIGNQSQATGNASTALGQGAVASGNGSVALGAGARASEDNVVSVGDVGAERRIVNVAAGINGTDAVNVDQLKAYHVGGVQYDKNPDGSNDFNRVTLNPNGGPTTVSNVAAGVAATDAVNLGQLQTGLGNTLHQANTYTDQRIDQLSDDVWSLTRHYRGATASALAAAGLPQAYLPGKRMLAASVGGYQSEYGIAVGLSGITDNGKWIYKGQVSGNTAREWGFSAGIGLQW